MSVLIKNMEMPKGCIYANDKDETEYCPMLNHDDVPFCQYIENEPEAAIGIDERPVYCPLEEYPEPCEDAVSRKDAIIQLSHNKNGDPDCDVIIQHDIEALKQLPSVTPKQERGKWNAYYHGINETPSFTYSCNQCGYSAPYGLYGGKYSQKEWNFCPNCGARMKEEDA